MDEFRQAMVARIDSLLEQGVPRLIIAGAMNSGLLQLALLSPTLQERRALLRLLRKSLEFAATLDDHPPRSAVWTLVAWHRAQAEATVRAFFAETGGLPPAPDS